MATDLGQIQAELTLNTSQFGGSLNDAGREAQGWAKNLGGSLATLAGGAVVAGGAAAAAAIGGIGFAALSSASDAKMGLVEIQAQLGVTAEEAKHFGSIAQDVFAAGLGGSINETSLAVAEVARQIKGLSDNEMEAATVNAFKLRDAYGIEVTEGVNTASTLMREFGLTQQQAFDFIAAGYQRGLNSSDDFLDTIGEYSNQFAEGGADASQFFSLMETGLAGGMLGTDKAADAFKEFRLRILDGSDATADGLKQIGLNADLFTSKVASGQMTVAEAFEVVTSRLSAQSDQAIQLQAGAALLGTQYEDLGARGVAALSLTTTSLTDMAGATDALNARYETWPALIEGIRRTFTVALIPLGDKLLEIGNAAMPGVQRFADWLEIALPPAVDGAIAAIDRMIPVLKGAVGGVRMAFEAIQGAWQRLTSVFSSGGEDVRMAFEAIQGAWQRLTSVFSSGGEGVRMAFEAIQGAWQRLTSVFSGGGEGVGGGVLVAISGIAAAIGLLVPGVGTIGLLTGALSHIPVVSAMADEAFAVLRETLMGLFGGGSGIDIGASAQVAIEAILAPFDDLRAAITTFAPEIAAAWQQLGGTFIEAIAPIRADLPGLAELAGETALTILAYLDQVSASFVAGFAAISTFLAAHSAEITMLIEWAWQTIRVVITTALELIKGILATTTAIMQGDWAGAWNAFSNMSANIMEGIIGLFEANLQRTISLLAGFTAAFAQAGRALMEGLAQGIYNGIAEATSALGGGLQSLRNMLPFSEPRDPSSPLRGLTDSGEAIVHNIQQGIDSSNGLRLPEDLAARQTGEDWERRRAGGIRASELAGSAADFMKPPPMCHGVTVNLTISGNTFGDGSAERVAEVVTQQLNEAWDRTIARRV